MSGFVSDYQKSVFLVPGGFLANFRYLTASIQLPCLLCKLVLSSQRIDDVTTRDFFQLFSTLIWFSFEMYFRLNNTLPINSNYTPTSITSNSIYMSS